MPKLPMYYISHVQNDISSPKASNVVVGKDVYGHEDTIDDTLKSQ
jgi:hypothetical protein